MTALRAWRGVALALLVAGCATAPVPPPEESPVEPDFTPAPAEPPPPLIESPPLEPVEPPPAAPPPAPVPPAAPRPVEIPAPAVTPPVATPPAGAPPVVIVPPPPAPVIVESPEDAQMNALLADLSRYAAATNDEVRREIGNATQALNRQRSDANRVRLAVLYTLTRGGQDDQRALQLFDNVAKSGGPPTAVKALAVVLQAQVAERQRAVREEQQKGEQAVRKLDQLLEMERTLLRDRVRSGGGGGGAGGGSAGH